nr:DNA mismatch repair protein MLH3 isoform X1 [Tanacetum cinerariifolium]
RLYRLRLIGIDSETSKEHQVPSTKEASAPSHQKHINKLLARDHLAPEVASVSDLQSKARPDEKKVIDKAEITYSATEAAHCLDVWHTNSGHEKEHESSVSVCLADEDSNFDASIYITEFPNGLWMSGCPTIALS